MKKTIYRLFKVSQNASTKEIVQNYKIMMKKIRLIKDKVKQKKLNNIYNFCFRILTNKDLRVEYDRILNFIEMKKQKLDFVNKIIKEHPDDYHNILENTKKFTEKELDELDIYAETVKGYKRAIDENEIEDHETIFEKMENARNRKDKTSKIINDLKTLPSTKVGEALKMWLDEEK